MKKIGISIDYSNICKDYNTVYLDRDNTDKETTACMAKVVEWLKGFLSEMLETFSYSIYRINQQAVISIDDVAHRRFLFYSLEKEMIMQTFVIQTKPAMHENLGQWAANSEAGLLVQNDAEGEGLFFYFNENSPEHLWLIEKLKDFSLDIVPFEER